MANNITYQYFTTLFDEFKTVPQPKVELLIGIATNRVPSSVWGQNTSYATGLLAAHMLSSLGGAGGDGGGVGGPVTAEAVGDLSRGYGSWGQAGTGDDELRLTRYGALFLELRRETVITPCVTGPETSPVGGLLPGYYQGGFF